MRLLNKEIIEGKPKKEKILQSLTNFPSILNSSKQKENEKIVENLSFNINSRKTDIITEKKIIIPDNKKSNKFILKNQIQIKKNYDSLLKSIAKSINVFTNEKINVKNKNTNNYLNLIYENSNFIYSDKIIILNFNAIATILNIKTKKIILNRRIIQKINTLSINYNIFLFFDENIEIIKHCIYECTKMNIQFHKIFKIERVSNLKKMFLDYFFSLNVENFKEIIIFNSLNEDQYNNLFENKNLEINSIEKYENIFPSSNYKGSKFHYVIVKNFEIGKNYDFEKFILSQKNDKKLNISEELIFDCSLIQNSLELSCFHLEKNKNLLKSLSQYKKNELKIFGKPNINSQTLKTRIGDLKKKLFNTFLSIKKIHNLKNFLVGPTIEDIIDRNQNIINNFIRFDLEEQSKIQKLNDFYIENKNKITLDDIKSVHELKHWLINNKLYILKNI